MAVGDLAKKAPPPSALVKGMDGDEPDYEGDADADDKAARVGLGEEVMAAMKTGDAAAFCDALDAYLDSRRG